MSAVREPTAREGVRVGSSVCPVIAGWTDGPVPAPVVTYGASALNYPISTSCYSFPE